MTRASNMSCTRCSRVRSRLQSLKARQSSEGGAAAGGGGADEDGEAAATAHKAAEEEDEESAVSSALGRAEPPPTPRAAMDAEPPADSPPGGERGRRTPANDEELIAGLAQWAQARRRRVFSLREKNAEKKIDRLRCASLALPHSDQAVSVIKPAAHDTAAHHRGRRAIGSSPRKRRGGHPSNSNEGDQGRSHAVCAHWRRGWSEMARASGGRG